MYNLEGKEEKGIITFNDKTYENEICIINGIVKLKRYNNEVEYTLTFDANNKTTTKYELKEYDSYINIDIVTRKLTIEKNKIYVMYTQIIEEQVQNFEYILEWEEEK